jgi:drug/metabolite transporter (DMT)-like permease
MLVATVSYLVLRYIRKVHYAVTNVAFGSWGTFENFGLALIFGVLSWPNCYKDWLAAFCLASLTFVGQMAIILAMKHEQAGPVSLVRTCDVIFAFFWQICVLDCWPEIYRYLSLSLLT